MKRKIAILLASVMTIAMPMSAMAATSKAPALIGTAPNAKADKVIQENPVNTQTGADLRTAILKREAVVKIGFETDETATIEKDTSFIINVENATFPETMTDFGYVNLDGAGDKVTTSTQDELAKFIKEDLGLDTAALAMPAEKPFGHIPYTIEKLSDTSAKVTIKVAVSNDDLQEYKNVAKDKVMLKKDDLFLAIPFGEVIVAGEGDVKVTVDNMGNNRIKTGTTTIAKGINSSAKTETKLSGSVKTFEDKVELSDIIVKELVSGSLKNEKITLRLGGGYKFKAKFKVKDGANTGIVSAGIDVDVDSENSSKATVTLAGIKVTNLLQALIFSGMVIEPINDRTYGDVELTISGEGLTEQTIVVAKREKLGFVLETKEDAKELVAGRSYHNNSNMLKKENITAKFRFAEGVENTLVSSRNLDFTVPEGVKIVGINTSDLDIKNFGTDADKPVVGDFEIINNGRTLRLKRSGYKTNEKKKAEMTMSLDLSIDPSFTGDVTLNVEGGGQSADSTKAIVIAKAIAPFKVETKSTKLNMGYQDYNTADIVITEAKPGMFLEGKEAILSLKAPYGTGEIGFSDAKFEVTGGELEVNSKDFNAKDKFIKFKINRASYKNPSTMTIKDVKVGTTRSVPFGSYDLSIQGEAVLNNYKKDIKDDTTEFATGNSVNVVNQNKTEELKVKNYVEVITATGTLDSVVKVTVGEKTVLVGDKAMDMDVAPYIQATSNSTMVPLRFVSLALGVDANSLVNADETSKISFDTNSKTTTIYYGAGSGQKIIQFQAGSNVMTVDGTKIPMEFGVVAEIKENRMFVPFRALGQALGVTVDWDADTKTAIYNQGNGRTAGTTTTATTTATTTETTTATTTAKVETTTETTTAK